MIPAALFGCTDIIKWGGFLENMLFGSFVCYQFGHLFLWSKNYVSINMLWQVFEKSTIFPCFDSHKFSTAFCSAKNIKI